MKGGNSLKRIDYLTKGLKVASRLSGYVTLGATASYLGITVYCKVKCAGDANDL